MRKLVATLTLVLGTAYHGNSAAFYVIRLKNGNEFVTGRYWQEGKQIMFDTSGGVFGIEKELINNIEVAKQPVRVEPPLPRPAEKARDARDRGANQKEEQTEKVAAPTPAADAADPILKEFYNLKGRFSGLKGMLTSELIDFGRDVANFKKKTRQSEKVNDYIRELAETSAMEDEVSAELRSRGQ